MSKGLKLLTVTLTVTIAVLVGIGCGRMPNGAQATTPETGAADSSVNEADKQLPFSNRETQKGSSVGPGALVPSSLTVPAGTPVPVRLQTAVSSATARPGEHFGAVLDEPLIIDGRTVAERGAAVVGRVVQSRRSGRLHDSGYLRLTLASIAVNGKQVPVQASSVFLQGGSHKKRDLALIGGGAGAGTLIGGLAGGGKGALLGGLIGAGGGTGTAYATGKKDVGFGPERRLTFRLTQPLVTG